MFEITDRDSVLDKNNEDDSSGFFDFLTFDGKKGMSVDNLFTIASWFATAVLFLVIIVFWNDVSGLDKLWNHNPTTKDIKSSTQSFIGLMDFMLVMAYFGLHIGIIVLGWLLRTHPILLVVGFVITAMLAVVAAPLSNTWSDFTSSGKLGTASGDLTVSDFIMDNLVKFEIVWAAITGIIMFGFARPSNRATGRRGFR